MKRAIAAILLACCFVSVICAASPTAPGANAAPATTGTLPAPPSGGTAPSNPPPSPDQGKPANGTQSSQPAAASPQLKPDTITAVLNSGGKPSPVGLNEQLLVRVTGVGQFLPSLDGSKYALFINGREVKGLPDAVYDPDQHGLVFQLKRNNDNKDLWTLLLGSPWPTEFTREVSVSLGERLADSKGSPQSTVGGNKEGTLLKLKVLPKWRFAIGLLLVAGVLWLVFAHASRRTTLRDNLLPQIAPRLQTYSLGRCQMAFWFVLIFCSFVFLFLLTWDYNTITAGALTLMCISGGTALAAVAVDAIKDSPADAINRGLRALGLNSYDDVARMQQEIDDRTAALAKSQAQLALLLKVNQPSPEQQQQIVQLQQDIPKLNTEILGRQGILRTYQDKTRPFLTQGWYKDLTTDLNGTAIHRLQVLCWTLVLGGVFLIGVYRDLSMPDFSATLLTLMGISSAGYVGFKYPEKNS